MHHHRSLADTKARAAIFLRHGDAEPAAFGDRLVEAMREHAIAVPLQPIVVAELVANRLNAVADGPGIVVFI